MRTFKRPGGGARFLIMNHQRPRVAAATFDVGARCVEDTLIEAIGRRQARHFAQCLFGARKHGEVLSRWLPD